MESKKKGKDSHDVKGKEKTKTKVKKEIKEYKRGLLDILDIHACAGSDIAVRDKRKSVSKDVLPYLPSLRSIPSSSFSEDSDLNVAERLALEGTKKNSRRKKKVNESYNREYFLKENSLYKSKPKVKDQYGVMDTSNPIEQLSYQITTNPECDIYPMTDKRKKDPLNFANILLDHSDDVFLSDNFFENDKLHINETNYSMMAYSREQIKKPAMVNSQPVTQKETKKINPEKINKTSKKEKNKCEIKFYNEEENLTTYPTINSEGEEFVIENKTKKLGEDNKKFAKKTLQKNTDRPTLCLYDCNKYPLTDYKGNILKTANGESLVLLKNGQPYMDCFKRLLYDKNGESSDSFHFSPYGTTEKNTEFISKIPLFDFRGYPLTDPEGVPLLNAQGNSLIIVDRHGKLLYDVNGNPVFDEAGIPLTKKDNCWLNPKGTPYRVFDKTKYPLTDKQGMTILNKNKKELLTYDKYGRPVLDYNGHQVYDQFGYCPTHPRFNPAIPLENELDNIVVLIGNVPVQIFDKEDIPLTDASGVVLKDADGKYLLKVDLLGNINQSVISGNNTIVSCKVNSVRNGSVYSKGYSCPEDDGNIKTTKKRANFLSRSTVNQFQSEDPPLKDVNGDFVYDFQGEQVFIDNQTINSCVSPSKTIHSRIKSRENINCLQSIYNFDLGNKVLIAKDKFYSNKEDSSDIVFNSNTDIYGRPLYDEDNKPLFDKYGRPVWDLFLRPLYDSQGHPLSTANGKRLKDGSAEKPGKYPGFDINYITLPDPEGRLKLKDHFGGPIHDKSGHPLYNISGKPEKDAFGRPLYDEDGFPLCDMKGLPASKAIRERGLRIASVEDKFQKLTVSSDNPWKTSHGGHGFNRTKYQGNSEEHTYHARVRLTTFTNGEKVIELLEIVPTS